LAIVAEVKTGLVAGQNKPLPPGLSLLLSASLSSGNWRWENGLQILVCVNRGGHNNIEINPEFRGMP